MNLGIEATKDTWLGTKNIKDTINQTSYYGFGQFFSFYLLQSGFCEYSYE